MHKQLCNASATSECNAINYDRLCACVYLYRLNVWWFIWFRLSNFHRCNDASGVEAKHLISYTNAWYTNHDKYQTMRLNKSIVGFVLSPFFSVNAIDSGVCTVHMILLCKCKRSVPLFLLSFSLPLSWIFTTIMSNLSLIWLYNMRSNLKRKIAFNPEMTTTANDDDDDDGVIEFVCYISLISE